MSEEIKSTETVGYGWVWTKIKQLETALASSQQRVKELEAKLFAYEKIVLLVPSLPHVDLVGNLEVEIHMPTEKGLHQLLDQLTAARALLQDDELDTWLPLQNSKLRNKIRAFLAQGDAGERPCCVCRGAGFYFTGAEDENGFVSKIAANKTKCKNCNGTGFLVNPMFCGHIPPCYPIETERGS